MEYNDHNRALGYQHWFALGEWEEILAKPVSKPWICYDHGNPAIAFSTMMGVHRGHRFLACDQCFIERPMYNKQRWNLIFSPLSLTISGGNE